MASAEQQFRIEKDSMGEVKVPQQAYYGAQTQRAIDNFPMSHSSSARFPREFIRAPSVSLRWRQHGGQPGARAA